MFIQKISCPQCDEVMSYRQVEEKYNYYNWNKQKHIFEDFEDGVYKERYYECLACGYKMNKLQAEIQEVG